MDAGYSIFSLITSLVCGLRARFSTEIHQGPSGAMFSPCTTLNNKQRYLSAFSFQSFILTWDLVVINPTEQMTGDIVDAE